MLDQPAVLATLAAAPAPDLPVDLTLFSRIVLTGMGSSDYATIPLELLLCGRGLPVWRLQTSRLLDTPEMLVDGTLLWITSQSGRSGEVVALLERISSDRRVTIVATTNDTESPIALAADHVLASAKRSRSDRELQELPEHPGDPAPGRSDPVGRFGFGGGPRHPRDGRNPFRRGWRRLPRQSSPWPRASGAIPTVASRSSAVVPMPRPH